MDDDTTGPKEYRTGMTTWMVQVHLRKFFNTGPPHACVPTLPCRPFLSALSTRDETTGPVPIRFQVFQSLKGRVRTTPTAPVSTMSLFYQKSHL